LDTEWARAKCAFKAIQYMALGIPAVISPVGMNTEIIEHGVSGFLAGDGAGWVESIDALLGQPERAHAVGQAGRRIVEQRYSLSVTSPALVEALR
jgi:glycosyltransferase involved in cell wall biosynthesis